MHFRANLPMLIPLLILLYITPTLFAYFTNFKRFWDVFVLNLLLGFLPPVWIVLVAAVWNEWKWWQGK